MKKPSTIEILKTPLLAVLFFLIAQGLAGGVASIFSLFVFHQTAVSGLALSLTLIAADLLALLFCRLALGSLHFPSSLRYPNPPYFIAFVGIISSLFFIVWTNLLNEFLGAPDLMQDVFLSILSRPLGIIAVVLVGPLTEELIFRQLILGKLLEQKVRPGMAIFFSALLFGIIHFNPAQILVATILGMVLGVLYWRTGNIVLPLIVHIINNGSAVIQLFVWGDKATEMSMIEELGGIPYALGALVLSLILGVSTLLIFIYNYKDGK